MAGPGSPYTQLDANQVLTQSFDEANDRLRVDATVTAIVTVSDTEIVNNTSGHKLAVNADGSINVDVVLTATADSISSWTKDGSGNAITSTGGALDVNVSAIALPTGAATSANQTTEIASLASIEEDIEAADAAARTAATNAATLVAEVSTTVQATSSATNIKLDSILAENQSIDSQMATLITVSSATNTKLDTSNSNTSNLSTMSTQLGTINGHLVNIENNTQPLGYAQGSTTAGQLGNLNLAAVHSTTPTYINSTTSPLSLTTAGALRVDGSNVTQPVSGTFWQATQPISAASLPLPSGAATSANQSTEITALGTINTTLGSPFQAGGSIGNTTFASTQSGTWTVQPGNTANTTPWYVKLPDGNNQTITKAVTTAGDFLDILTNGASTVTFQAIGSFSGLIAAYGTDDGTTLQNIPLYSWSDFSTQTFSGDNSGYSVNVGGWKTVRIKQVTLTSGTPTIYAWISPGVGPHMVTSQLATAFKVQANSYDSSGNGITSTGNALDVNLKTSSITLPISVASLPLPSGAATSALQTTGNTSLASIDSKIPANLTVTSTRLLVDGSGVTQPVSGTFFQATQPVSIASTVTISGTVTANAGSGTFAISAASLPLPTGAATSALQTTINTTLGSPFQAGGSIGNTAFIANAGTNLNTSALALDATLAKLTLAQESTTSGQTGALILGAVTTAAPTYTTGKSDPLSLTTTGLLRVDGSGVTQPISGTVTANAGSGTMAVSIASLPVGHNIIDSGTLTAVTSITNALPAGSNVIGHVITDTNSTTAVTGNVTVVQPTGTNLHTVIDSGTLTAVTAITNALPAGSNVIGHVITDTNSTTAVTGNVTVVQPTGTNLHTVIDSGTITTVTAVTAITNALPAGSNVIGHVITDTGSTTVVTGNVTVVQPTGTNLHAVIDSGTLTTVSTVTAVTAITNALPAGSNVIGHVITDTGSTTAVTGNVTVVQTTASNLNAQVQGPAASGVAKSGNPLQNGAVFNTAQPTVTTGQIVEAQATARGALIVATGADVFTATGPTLTKGTQGSTGFSVQNLMDAGRVHVNYYANGVTAGATGVETAITLTKSSGTSATSTGVSFVITSGKKYRIMSICVSTRGNVTATAQVTTFNLRVNTAGAVVVTSTPIVFARRLATVATALAYDHCEVTIPEGFEITGDGTLQFGITTNSVFVTNAPTLDIQIIGFEY